MFRKFVSFIFVVYVFLLVFHMASYPTEAKANNSCRGYIIDQPAGLGLPVFDMPSYSSQFVDLNLEADQAVTVYETSYSPVTGEIWFRIDSGWLQSYSGYTTGVSSILLSDYGCVLPYRIEK